MRTILLLVHSVDLRGISLILLFLVLLILNIVSLRQEKSISYYNIIQSFTIQIGGLFLAYPLRTILETVSPNINSILFSAICIAFISYLCMTIKSLSINGKFPSKSVSILSFIVSFVLAGLILGVNSISILYAMHSLILSSLALLGWEIGLFKPFFEPIGGFINLFSTRNEGGMGGNSGGTGNSSGLSNTEGTGTSISTILSQLNGLTRIINHQFSELQNENENFENHWSNAKHYRDMGAEIGAEYYTDLARESRTNISNGINTVQDTIANRSRLVSQARRRFVDSRLNAYDNITDEQLATLNVSDTLAHNQIWDI